MTIRTALRTSSNRAAVHMLEQVGIEPTVSYAQRLGIGTLSHAPSLALGSGEVTLLSMTSAYAAFAHAGIVEEPTFIRRVEDRDGAVLFRSAPKSQRVLSETTAFLMANMLADVLDIGTASRARSMGFTLPAAGKTGTTNDFVDAWFVGFTPPYRDWRRDRLRSAAHDRGEWVCGPVGGVALGAVHERRDLGTIQRAGFSRPQASQPCKSDTGEVTYKSMVYTEYFDRGTEPSEACMGHFYQEPQARPNGRSHIQTQLSSEPVPTPSAEPASVPLPIDAPLHVAVEPPPGPQQ